MKRAFLICIILTLFSLSFMLIACENSGGGKIKLRARDTAKAAFLGHWVLTDSSALLLKHRERQTSDRLVTEFYLKDNSSAQIYLQEASSQKELKASWQCDVKKTDSASAEGIEDSALVIKAAVDDGRLLRLNLSKIRIDGTGFLLASDSLTYKKLD